MVDPTADGTGARGPATGTPRAASRREQCRPVVIPLVVDARRGEEISTSRRADVVHQGLINKSPLGRHKLTLEVLLVAGEYQSHVEVAIRVDAPVVVVSTPENPTVGCLRSTRVGQPDMRIKAMLLHDSRREARLRDGELVLLPEQDRSLWHQKQMEDGRTELRQALALGGRGPYVLQAAIASLHTEEERDVRHIASLYSELGRLTGSPVVELNRAVAEVEGPEAGLRIIDQLDLDDYRYLHSTRGELLFRLGRIEEARAAYRRALTLIQDEPERRLVERRLVDLDRSEGPVEPG